MTRAALDSNHHKGIIVSDPTTHDPIDVTGDTLANAKPIHTAIVDSDGNQITSFGGGTQYESGDAVGATTTGTALMVPGDTTYEPVSDDNGLPVKIISGLLPFPFDDIEFSGTPDAFGNYPTATVRNDGVDKATLTFTYDVNGTLTRLQRS